MLGRLDSPSSLGAEEVDIVGRLQLLSTRRDLLAEDVAVYFLSSMPAATGSYEECSATLDDGRSVGSERWR